MNVTTTDFARLLRPLRILVDAAACVRLERVFGIWGRPRPRLYAPDRRRVLLGRGWSSVDAVLAAIDGGGFEDLLALRLPAGYVALHFPAALDPFGETEPHVEEVVRSLRTYVELDGAGGLLALAYGVVPADGRRRGTAFIQDRGFVLLTGRRWQDAPASIGRIQPQLDALTLGPGVGQFLANAPKAKGAKAVKGKKGFSGGSLTEPPLDQPPTLAEQGITKESAPVQADTAREAMVDALIKKHMGAGDGAA